MEKKINYSDKILIAGAKGMAGKAIYRSLSKKGYGKKKDGGEIYTPSKSELNFLKIKEVKDWFEFNKPNVVIIAAAKVGGILANSLYPTEFLFENLTIQTNIIKTAWDCKVKRLLFLGSSCIYPKFAQQPIQEEALLTGELEKTNEAYAIAKISGIKLCESLRLQYGFDAISLMPTNLYGEGDNYDLQNSHVMAALIRKFYEAQKYSYKSITCWGTGSPLREFLHVDDLGDAVIFALESWDPDKPESPRKKDGQPLYFLNVGTGQDISIKNLANKISNLVSFKGEILWDKSKPDGTPKKQLNTKKINSLGWSPKISLDEGIKKTLKLIEKQNLL